MWRCRKVRSGVMQSRPWIFDLAPNEILCVVGESGSGKSLTARAVMGLLPRPHVHIAEGSIHFGDEDLAKVSEARLQGAFAAT